MTIRNPEWPVVQVLIAASGVRDAAGLPSERVQPVHRSAPRAGLVRVHPPEGFEKMDFS